MHRLNLGNLLLPYPLRRPYGIKGITNTKVRVNHRDWNLQLGERSEPALDLQHTDL